MRTGTLFFIAAFFSVAAAGFAQDPMSMACDFEKGSGKWRGGTVKTDEKGNKVCQLKKTGKSTSEITHKVKLEEARRYTITYRARALPGSEGVKIRSAVRSSSGAGFVTRDLPADGKWVTHKFSAAAPEGERSAKREAVLIFFAGKGVLQIDDITVEVGN